ncbi:MAG: hypothetical protein U0931_11520 [Vulcanimicrobiota bacterium]
MSELSAAGSSPATPPPSRPAAPATAPPSQPAAPAPSNRSEPRDRSTLTPPSQEKAPKSTEAHLAGLNTSFSNKPTGSAQPPSIQERTKTALDSGNAEQQREIVRELRAKQKRGERLSPEEVQAARQIQERPMAIEATIHRSQGRTENGREIRETHRFGFRSQDPHRPNGLVHELERSTERKYQGSPRVPLLPYAGRTSESRETIDLNTGKRRKEDVQSMDIGLRRNGIAGEQVTPQDGRQPHTNSALRSGIEVPFLKVGIGGTLRFSSSDQAARRDARLIAVREAQLQQTDRMRETVRQAMEAK